MGEIIHELKMYMTGTEFRKALQISEEKEIACQLLAQGEYNINYLCKHLNTGESFVLRINTGSQMHLENQIEYEYSALKIWKIVDERQKYFGGTEVKRTSSMEFLQWNIWRDVR